MRIHGTTSLHEMMGDFVVYRNLDPADARLPRLSALRQPGPAPRKSDMAYAQAIARLLQQAQSIVHPGVPLSRLVYLGDTRLLDSTAFRNLKALTGWPGWAFIASEDLSAADHLDRQGDLWLANRWSALTGFLAFLEAEDMFQGGPSDSIGASAAHVVLIVDMDKTAIGARGRNDRMIDEARLAAAYETVQAALGDRFKAARGRFDAAYVELNQPRYHAFTADNQDYLVYICLMSSAGLYDLPALLDDLATGRLTQYSEFMQGVEAHIDQADPGVAAVHRQVRANVLAGDPTPFKAFRYNEYRATVARMGCVEQPDGVEDLLAREIVITQEVREAALWLRARGALVFGLTDKPDEAAVPPPGLAAEGYQPLHRVVTHAVGKTLALR